jgi:hypothetical protein
VHLQLSIIRLSRDVQQTAHLRDFLVVSCLARSIACASSIPASKGRGLMSIPIKTLYDLKFFCLGVFAMCNKVIVFLNLRGMKETQASPSFFIILRVGWYNLRGWQQTPP